MLVALERILGPNTLLAGGGFLVLAEPEDTTPIPFRSLGTGCVCQNLEEAMSFWFLGPSDRPVRSFKTSIFAAATMLADCSWMIVPL
jgi:hypothetical protein